MAGIIEDPNKLGGVPQSASNHVAMSTCFDVYLQGSILVGFISSVTINNTRTVTQIRHLNSVDAGIAVDTVVTPDAPTLAFNGFYVYSDSASKQLSAEITGNKIDASNGGVGPSIGRVAGVNLLMTLDQQNIPFAIVMKHVAVTDIIAGVGTETIIGAYRNCSINSMSIPIQVGTAAVSDSGSITVGYVASGVK